MQNTVSQSSGDITVTISRTQAGLIYAGLIHLASELSEYKRNPDKPPHALLALLNLRGINPDQFDHNQRAIMRAATLIRETVSDSPVDDARLTAAQHHLDQFDDSGNEPDMTFPIAALDELEILEMNLQRGEILHVEAP